MTLTPLFEYTANQLQSAVSLYDTEGQPSSQYPVGVTRRLPQLYPQLILRLCHSAVSDYPVFSFVNGEICFVHFTLPESYAGQTAIIGPFRMLFVENTAHAIHTFTFEPFCGLTKEHIPYVYPPLALSLTLLLFNCCHCAALTETECWQKNFDTQHMPENANRKTTADIFSNRENQKMHNPYTQELRLLKTIEDGNIEMLQKTWQEPMTGTLGTTAKDPIRNGKNMALYIITACGRAAIRAGLSAEYIFSLTDSYSQQVEELKNMLLLQPLVEKAELHFTQLVAELKTNKQSADTESPLIHRCKDYIFKHLHDTLTVSQIADELQVHPNYLNTLFRRQEGKSLYQYILNEKINLTKNLLTYSDYSYLEIAHYLGFLSQSHLGTRFKSITGMTLKQYRDRYRKEIF